MRVVISSGHGIYVAGAVGIIEEVAQARRLVDRVAQLMYDDGINAVVFHDDVSRNQRDNLNTIISYHNSMERCLDVSVHFNAFKPTDAHRGVEVLHKGDMLQLAAKASCAIAQAGGLRDRGPKKRANLGFLNNTNGPSILIETCFVDSAADVSAYQKNFEAICRAIADTLNDYCKALADSLIPAVRGTPKVSDVNIQSMVSLGVINSPNYWKTLSGSQYLDTLLGNAAREGLLHPLIDNGITETGIALDVLQDAGIITVPGYWDALIRSQTIPYLDTLVINVSNKARIVLEKLIQSEAGGEDIHGKVLVGNVVMNRHLSPNFPTGIHNVVFQRGSNSAGQIIYQFSPVGNGAYAAAKPSPGVKAAVDRLMEGEDASGGALFFIANSSAPGSWHEKSRTKLFVHGGHTFYA